MKLTRFNKIALTAALLIILACGGGGGGTVKIPAENLGYYFDQMHDVTLGQLFDFLDWLSENGVEIEIVDANGNILFGQGPIDSMGDYQITVSGNGKTAIVAGHIGGTPLADVGTVSGSINTTFNATKLSSSYPFAGSYPLQYSGGDQGSGTLVVNTGWKVSGTLSSNQFGSVQVAGNVDGIGRMQFQSTNKLTNNTKLSYTGNMFFEPNFSMLKGKGTWQGGPTLTGGWDF